MLVHDAFSLARSEGAEDESKNQTGKYEHCRQVAEDHVLLLLAKPIHFRFPYGVDRGSIMVL
jgi:hypothetical protein